MATNFGQNLLTSLHSAHWRSETDWDLAISMNRLEALIITPHHVQSWWTLSPLTPGITTVKIVTFWTMRKKSAYSHKYLRK